MAFLHGAGRRKIINKEKLVHPVYFKQYLVYKFTSTLLVSLQIIVIGGRSNGKLHYANTLQVVESLQCLLQISIVISG